jgi:hypothetical protein
MDDNVNGYLLQYMYTEDDEYTYYDYYGTYAHYDDASDPVQVQVQVQAPVADSSKQNDGIILLEMR